MKDENTQANPIHDSPLSERAAKLSTRGAHYFVGWLISSGKHIPEVAAEFERALHHLENDPNLRSCWRESHQTDDITTPGAQAALSLYQEQPATPGEVIPSMAVQHPPQDQSGSSVPQVETTPALPSLVPTSFFGWLFRRERIAA